MVSKRLEVILAALVGFIVLVGCTGGISVDTHQPGSGLSPMPEVDRSDHPKPGPIALLPLFPPVADPASVRLPSADNSITMDGIEFMMESGAGNRVGATSPDAFVLLPGDEDDLAYAIYNVAELSADRPLEISFEVTAAPFLPGDEDDLLTSYWVGLSNYTMNSWDWLGPFDASHQMILNDESTTDRYVSPGIDPELFFVVLTDSSMAEMTPENPLGMTAVEIIASIIPTAGATSEEYEETAPPYTEINGLGMGSGSGHGTSALQESQHVILTWEHIEDPHAPDCEAMYVRVYRTREDQGQKLPIGTVDSLKMSFTDPVDNSSPLNTVIPGARYTYWVRSGNNGGMTRYSYPLSVTIPLHPPSNVQASDGEFADRIVVTWGEAEGATGYEVYRDVGTGPVAIVGNVTTWEDTSVADFSPHSYRLKSVNQYATSAAYSIADPGYQSTSPVAILEIDPGEELGAPPHLVHFDASASYDPDETGPPGTGITQYEWDWDGDGTYDFNSGVNPLQTRTYLFEDTYTPTVRVTDNEADTGTDYVTIRVEPPVEAWRFETFAAEDDVDQELYMPRLTLDGAGNPAVSFIHTDGSGSDQARCMRYGEGIWYDEFTFTDNGELFDIDYDGLQDQLITCFNESLPGSMIQLGLQDIASWVYEDVPDTEQQVSFAFDVFDGTVGVAFENRVFGVPSLWFSSFSGAWSSVFVDDTFDSISSVAPNISLAFNPATGLPVIAYTVFPAADLRVAWFDSAVWVVDTVASTGETGYYPALAVSNAGESGVAFMDWTGKRLMFGRSMGGGTWNVVEVDGAGSPGDHCNSVVFDPTGNPAISYHESQNGDLRFARHDGAGWNRETLDANSAGYWSDLVNAPDGQFAIVYQRSPTPETTELVYGRYGFSLH